MIDPFQHKYCENFDEEKSLCRESDKLVIPTNDCCDKYLISDEFFNLEKLRSNE
jgi:hypothetical protein